MPESLSLDEALEKNPVGLFQYRLLLMCGFAFMTDGLEVNLLTFLATCAGDEWGLSDQQQAAITGAVFAGILVGSLFWGLFADRFGRRLTFLIACGVISAGGFLSGAAPNYAALISFRALVGFGIGGANIPFDLLAEFLPSSHRGRFLIYIEYFWTFGSLFVSGLAWASLSRYGWRFLTIMTAIPVTATSLFSVWCLPESPRWLLLKGRISEAEDVVRQAAAVNGIKMEPFSLRLDGPDLKDAMARSSSRERPSTAAAVGAAAAAAKDLAEDEKDGEEGDANAAAVDKVALLPPQIVDLTYLDLLRNPSARRVSLPLWAVWGLFGFTYYGIILFVGRIYTTSASDDDGSPSCSFDYSSIFINATSEVAGVTISALAIDRMGRIRVQCWFYVAAAVAVCVMGLGLPANAVLAVSIVGRMAVMAASNATWVCTPELYNTEMRTMGHAICVACSKLGAFTSPFVVVSSLGNFSVGLVLAVMNLLAAAAASMLPETSGLGLERPSSFEDSARECLISRHVPAAIFTKGGDGGGDRDAAGTEADADGQHPAI